MATSIVTAIYVLRSTDTGFGLEGSLRSAIITNPGDEATHHANLWVLCDIGDSSGSAPGFRVSNAIYDDTEHLPGTWRWTI